MVWRLVFVWLVVSMHGPPGHKPIEFPHYFHIIHYVSPIRTTEAVCEFLRAPEIFGSAVVIEYFEADNNDLILSASKALDVEYQHDSQESL